MPKVEKVYKNKRVVPYNSGATAPHYILSNFAEAPIKAKPADFESCILQKFPRWARWLGDGATFPSAEHLWQSLKAKDRRSFGEFLTGGLFSSLDEVAFAMFYAKPEECARKQKYWSKKKNVGILAKLAANPSYRKRLPIVLNYQNEKLDENIERSVWRTILRLKFEQNAEHRAVLEESGDSYLLEHSRSAQRAFEKFNKKEHWTGLVDNNGTLFGENAMGEYLMQARDDLCVGSQPDVAQ